MADTTPFRALHAPGNLLCLANAWDAGSARLFESLGSPAIATTSSGVAWAHGYPDGDTLPVDILVATVRAIARVVAVPLTVDVEGGYADDPAAVAATVARVIDAGAAGINIEDGSGPPQRLAAKIAAIKGAAAAAGVDLFVNARIDVYLRQLVPPEGLAGELAARIATYREAGADGVFAPGLADPGAIAAAVDAAGALPLNLMAVPGLPDATALRALGVRRLSAGGAVASAAWATAQRLSGAFIADGSSAALFADDAIGYAAMNALMRP